MEASQKLSSNLARSHGLKRLVTRCLPLQRHVPVAEIPPFLTRGTPLLRSLLTRCSVVISCPSHPGCVAQAGWLGLGLDKDAGGGRCGWATRSESRTRAPQAPASAEARAGHGEGRGCALSCCSVSTQVLHGRRPGGGCGAQAGRQPLNTGRSPRVPTASLVALGDSQLASMAFAVRGGGGSGWNNVPCEHSRGACDADFNRGKTRPGCVCVAPVCWLEAVYLNPLYHLQA